MQTPAPSRRALLQNDARAIDEIEAMKRAIDAGDFFRRTGGSINQQLVAPKLRWIEHHEPTVFARIATVFGSYDYITWRLTGARSIEQNWALESGLVEISSGRFDPELVALAGIAADRLPPIRVSQDVVGQVTAAAAAATGLKQGTPVVAGCADLVASAFLAGAVADGDMVLKFGGSGDILLAVAKPLTDPRLYIDHHLVPGLWFSNGCMAASGSLLNWIVREWAAGETANAAAAGLSVHAWLDRLAAATPAGADGLVLLPYFLGEKTPLHDPHARGTLIGLGLHHRLAHVMAGGARGCGVRIPAPCGRLPRTRRRHAADRCLRRRRRQRPVAANLRRCTRPSGPAPASSSRLLPGRGLCGGHRSWRIQGLAGRRPLCRAGRGLRADRARVALYDRAYAAFRETYERLKTLYPKLRFTA
jgi:xylulokinase